MEIWEFMKAYAESFWAQGEYAYEFFRVLMAWFLYCLVLDIVFYL